MFSYSSLPMLYFSTVIIQEGKDYVARCVETGVVSQGKNIPEAQKNLKEAMELFLEDSTIDQIKMYKKRSHAYLSSLELDYA